MEWKKKKKGKDYERYSEQAIQELKIYDRCKNKYTLKRGKWTKEKKKGNMKGTATRRKEKNYIYIKGKK